MVGKAYCNLKDVKSQRHERLGAMSAARIAAPVALSWLSTLALDDVRQDREVTISVQDHASVSDPFKGLPLMVAKGFNLRRESKTRDFVRGDRRVHWRWAARFGRASTPPPYCLPNIETEIH